MKKSKNDLPVPDPIPVWDENAVSAGIKFRNVRAETTKQGDVILWVPCSKPTEQETATIRKLFPNLSDKVWELLDVEMLLACLV